MFQCCRAAGKTARNGSFLPGKRADPGNHQSDGRDKDGKLALAICHPSGWLLAQELGMLLGERLERPVLAREDDITDIINRIFGESTRSEGSVSDVLGDSVNAIDEFNEDAVEDLLEDILFSSSSAAAEFVLGYSASGLAI